MSILINETIREWLYRDVFGTSFELFLPLITGIIAVISTYLIFKNRIFAILIPILYFLLFWISIPM